MPCDWETLYWKLFEEHIDSIKDNEKKVNFLMEVSVHLIILITFTMLYYFFGEEALDVLRGTCKVLVKCPKK